MEPKHVSETVSEIGERAITVTESAAKRIAFLREQEQVGDANLRIAVSGGGCSGFQYGMSFDDQTNPDDRVFERDGVGVVVDDVSLICSAGPKLISSRISWAPRSRSATRTRPRPVAAQFLLDRLTSS